MKKNMEFDQFDKRTATERLQLYEDALVVYALLYKIKDSPYMYLFKDQIALMKISMIIPLDSIKYEVTCESSIEINVDMGIDTLLLKMADISDIDLPLDDETKNEKISSGVFVLILMLNLADDTLSLDALALLTSLLAEISIEGNFDRQLTEIRQINTPLLNALIRLEQNNVFSAKVLRPVLKILSRTHVNIGIDFFMSLPQGDKWEKYKITKRDFFELLYKLPPKESLAVLKYIPETDYSQLVDIYENKDVDRFLAITENLNVDYVMANYNYYANCMSIFDIAKNMVHIDLSSADQALIHLMDLSDFSKANYYSLKNISDPDLYFMLHGFKSQIREADKCNDNEEKIRLIDKATSILEKNNRAFYDIIFPLLCHNNRIIPLKDSLKIEEILQTPPYKEKIEKARQEYLSSLKYVSDETTEGYSRTSFSRIIKSLTPYFKLTPADKLKAGKCFCDFFLMDLIQIASNLSSYYDIHGFAYVLYNAKCFDLNGMTFNDFVKLIIDIFPLSHIQINAQPYSLSKSKFKAEDDLMDKHKALKELFESNFKSKEE